MLNIYDYKQQLYLILWSIERVKLIFINTFTNDYNQYYLYINFLIEKFLSF